MNKLLAILSILLYTTAISAQNDVALRVRKAPVISIYPENMYFQSHTPRTFTIRGIPSGCKMGVSFGGGDLSFHDSILTLEPFYVLRDTDLSKPDSKYFTGYTTKGDFYTTELHVSVLDSRGEVKASLKRTCYIKAEKRPHRVQESAATLQPGAMKILKLIQPDSAVGAGPGK